MGRIRETRQQPQPGHGLKSCCRVLLYIRYNDMYVQKAVGKIKIKKMKLNGKTWIYVLGVLLVAMAIFLWQSPVANNDLSLDEDRLSQEPAYFSNLTQIPVTRSFDGNTHTYTGVITLPTPCYNLNVEAIVAESFPEQVRVEINATPTGEVCAQVLTDKPFQVSFQASERATVQGFLNSIPIDFVEM